jgi:hypothetical protein
MMAWMKGAIMFTIIFESANQILVEILAEIAASF